MPFQPQTCRIIGIDPGSRTTGFALIQSSPSRGRNSYELIELGIWRPGGGQDYLARIAAIHANLTTLLRSTQPTHLVMESVYVGRYPQSAIKLSELRGALLAAAFTHELVIKQLSATYAKKAITGGGSTTKQGVAHVLKGFFPASPLLEQPQPPDATDALALALAYALTKSVDDRIHDAIPR